MIQCFIDVETTGLWQSKHGIWQISAITRNEECVLERFTETMNVFPGDAIDDEALKVGGITREDLSGFQEPTIAYRKFETMLETHVDKYDKQDKMQFLAYNAPFDSQFVRAWMKKNGNNYFGSYFWHPQVCVMNYAAARLMSERFKLADFKQMTIATHLGINVDTERLHDAEYDIELTMAIYDKLKGGM